MLIERIFQLRHRLVFRLILAVGFTLLVCIATWAYFNIDYQESKLTENIVVGTDRLTNTIKLGTHYAMMLNSRDDINQIITNIGKLKEIQNIRIYNKNGQIKYSNHRAEVDTTTNIKAEACDICHRTEPPLVELALQERTRLLDSDKGYRLLGIISPIFNEPGCATDACHVHPEGKKVLGALDVVVSLQETDLEILLAKKGMVGLAGFAFFLISSIVGRRLRRLAEGIEREAADGRDGDGLEVAIHRHRQRIRKAFHVLVELRLHVAAGLLGGRAVLVVRAEIVDTPVVDTADGWAQALAFPDPRGRVVVPRLPVQCEVTVVGDMAVIAEDEVFQCIGTGYDAICERLSELFRLEQHRGERPAQSVLRVSGGALGRNEIANARAEQVDQGHQSGPVSACQAWSSAFAFCEITHK